MIKIIRGTVFLLLWMGVACVRGFAQELVSSAALSLEDCVRMALAKSPDLSAAVERLEQAKAQLVKTYAPFSPQGTLNANQVEFGHDLFSVVNSGNRWDAHTRTASLSANWNLFNGFKDFDRWKAAGFDTESAKKALEAARQQLALQTVQIYFSLLLADKSIEAQKESMKSKQEHLQLAQARYKAGIRSYSDVLNAQIQLKQSEVRVIQAESQKKSALHALNILLGFPISQATEIQDVLGFEPAAEDLDKDVAAAFEQRPEVRQAQDQVRGAQALYRLAVHDTLPLLGLNGVYNYNFTSLGTSGAPSVSGSASPNFSPNPFWQVNIGLSFPFWDGGTRLQEIRRSHAAEREALAGLEKAKRAVQRDVSQAYLDLDTNRQVYEVTKGQVDAAKEDLHIVSERYKNGSASILEVVDAQANLLNVRLDLIQSLYNFHTAKFSLRRAIGAPLF